MIENDRQPLSSETGEIVSRQDHEEGLRAPPEVRGWRKVWWWIDFVILVKLARLRFVGILLVIGVIITQWDTLTAYYDKWTRPARESDTGGSDVEYFCPMHPSVVRAHPQEKCPICFMPLSKRMKTHGRLEPLPAGVVNRVQLSPYRVVLAGVRTWTVDYLPLTKEITAVGFVEFNERGQRTVSARAGGRIDKLFVNETGKMVNAGDELALIYSPDLLVAVENLLVAKRGGNEKYLETTRTRLELLGIDREQIDEILAASKANTHLKIRSPISGHVITKYVREGQYVQEGTALYDVADLSTVWIQAQIYEDDLAFLPVDYEHGSATLGVPGLDVLATTRAFPDQPFRGKLAFIYPHVDQETRTVTVRFELDNPGHLLRPGSTATVTLNVPAKDVPGLKSESNDALHKEMLDQGRVLAAPESSVIDTGSQRIVYRQTSPGVYEGVEVRLGSRMSGDHGALFYPVLGGLEPGDQVVTSGSFLVDAETRINPAAGSIYFGGAGGDAIGQTPGESSSASAVRPSTPEDPEATIRASMAALSPEDRKAAQSQRFCPVLAENRLGSMGTPMKVFVDGHAVFVCCRGCRNEVLAHPKETLEKVKQLHEAHGTFRSRATE